MTGLVKNIHTQKLFYFVYIDTEGDGPDHGMPPSFTGTETWHQIGPVRSRQIPHRQQIRRLFRHYRIF